MPPALLYRSVWAATNACMDASRASVAVICWSAARRTPGGKSVLTRSAGRSVPCEPPTRPAGSRPTDRRRSARCPQGRRLAPSWRPRRPVPPAFPRGSGAWRRQTPRSSRASAFRCPLPASRQRPAHRRLPSQRLPPFAVRWPRRASAFMPSITGAMASIISLRKASVAPVSMLYLGPTLVNGSRHSVRNHLGIFARERHVFLHAIHDTHAFARATARHYRNVIDGHWPDCIKVRP